MSDSRWAVQIAQDEVGNRFVILQFVWAGGSFQTMLPPQAAQEMAESLEKMGATAASGIVMPTSDDVVQAIDIVRKNGQGK